MNSFIYNGFQVIEHSLCTEPKIKLSKDVNVSDEFRSMMNAKLEAMFGRKPNAYLANGKLYAHPKIVQQLRRMFG